MNEKEEIVDYIKMLRHHIEFTHEKEPRDLLRNELWALQKRLIEIMIANQEGS